MPKYQLAVDDVVNVPVKFTFKMAGVNKLFSFTVFATRLPQEEITARLEEKDKKASDFIRDLLTGWKDQAFVLDEDGKPAEFNADSRDFMLDAAGVASVIFNAYLVEAVAKVKN